ncbi:YdcF family protein [Clostridium sp. YIM B02506]|uniref:YdcF family protein n=1 Tax=Clostridium sp. YIM B02506 TaxID=2910680 RepID=UPI001EEE012A|nr:YdcF family protein [Clostridium sp. YIM B02506]
MIKKITKEIVDSFNEIIKYLAKRDIKEISKEELLKKYNIDKVDLLIILGSAIPYIAEEGGRAYKSNLAKEIMIVGGIGHSTIYLEENILNNLKYEGIEVKDRAEADILKDVLVKNLSIKEEDIIIENKSTNCGSNAHETFKVIKELNKKPKTILILQDPTMQLRTDECFKKEWKDKQVEFINYSCFVPLIKEENGEMKFIDNDIYGLWDMHRFISLIMGEIPRLKDDENGYGPRGKGFIGHVDIPKEVLEAYEVLLPYYSEYLR